MLSARHVARVMAGATDQSAAHSVPGRTVLLVGEAARQRAGVLVETMQACGCQPAIVAALVPKHLGETLKGTAERVRCAMFRTLILCSTSQRLCEAMTCIAAPFSQCPPSATRVPACIGWSADIHACGS